ncbi:MAG TPA: hypothetical protein VMB51_12185 [Solirubrobacteraceae bacterium]|nr:hypothetical protein [Solirubrobacteraceae bacterium]
MLKLYPAATGGEPGDLLGSRWVSVVRAMDNEHRRIELPHLVFDTSVEERLVALAHRSEYVLVARKLIERLLVEHPRMPTVSEVSRPDEPQKPLGDSGVSAGELPLETLKLGSLILTEPC